MRTRIAALVMAALLVLYLVFVASTALRLILEPEPAAKALGIALGILPLLGAWALIAELTFVTRANRLLAELEREGLTPDDGLPRLASGRVDPKAADAVFPEYKREVEDHPESWQSWLRLGLAYDACGDRGRARWATRQAIAFERAKNR